MTKQKFLSHDFVLPAMGILSAMGDLGMGVGPVLMGIILRWATCRIMFLGLAVIGLINFSYYYLLTKKAKEKAAGMALPNGSTAG